MNRDAIVPRAEATELVKCTKTIDAAVVSILALLENHEIARDIVMDLAEIASNSLYVRDQIERALERGAKPAEALVTS